MPLPSPQEVALPESPHVSPRGDGRADGARPRGPATASPITLRPRLRPRPSARRPLRRHRLLRHRGQLQQRLDGLWNEHRGYYEGGGGGVEPMVNSLMLLGHSVAAMQGHTGPSRNDERARSLALELVKGAVRHLARRRPEARAGLDELDERARLPAPRLRRRGGRRARLRLPGTPGAAAPGLDGERHPRRHLTHRPRVVLALPDDPPEPDQLVRADVRRRRDRHRRPGAAQARLQRPAHALRARREGELRRRHAVPLPPARARQPPDERGLGRVREHRAQLHALLRPGPPRRHAGDARRSQAGRVGVDRARDRRLLDARRLHELGLRPRLPALAPVQEARAHAAGADRDRVGAVAQRPAVAALREVPVRPSLEFYARTSDRDGGIADALFFNVHAVPQGVASARLGAARVLANAARAIDAGLGRARSPSRPRCTPSTRTSAASP